MPAKFPSQLSTELNTTTNLHKTPIGISPMTAATSPDRKYRRGSKAPLISGKHSHREVFSGGEGALGGAVFNLSTTIVGAGIMALPATLKQLGMVPGLIVVVLAAFLTESSIDLVLRFSRASKSSTYAGLVGDAFGGLGRSLLQACVVLNNIGMLVVYLIIIGDVLAGTWAEGIRHTGVMEEWFGQSWWTTRFLLLLLTTLFVFGPLISFKRVDSLRYTSAVSVGLAIAFVAITAGIALVKMVEGGVQAPPMLPKLADQASFWKLFTTIPVLVTAYICHHNIHPIENELIDTSQMKPIVRTSLTLCTSVYIATSIFGYLLFGEKTLDDILANFDGDLGIPYSSLLNDIVRVSYCVHLMLVFPIVFFSLCINFDGLLFPYAVPIAYDNKRFFTLTFALMGLIFLGANFVPNIWDAFQFTGATTAVSIGFIFPAAVTLRDTHNISTRKDRLTSMMMILLAVSSSTVAISSDIYDFFHPSNGDLS